MKTSLQLLETCLPTCAIMLAYNMSCKGAVIKTNLFHVNKNKDTVMTIVQIAVFVEWKSIN